MLTFYITTVNDSFNFLFEICFKVVQKLLQVGLKLVQCWKYALKLLQVGLKLVQSWKYALKLLQVGLKLVRIIA